MDTATQSPASEGLLARLPGDPRQRQILVAAALSLLIFALLLGGYLMLRPNYIVLFRGLKPLDAAAVVKELEKEKIPYRYDEAANAILVPEGESKAARIKLGSADLRLQDVVGLELFKDSDLGLTEFAQKVNYQRALQGEVARTLMSLEEVDMARVHLTLPESSIFRRDQAKPKASVTIFPKGEAPLGEDSIRGIQKLVAASVPGMTPADVIVLDQRGAAATADEIGEVSDPKFALKQAIERSYEKKIAEQLARVLGETGATVSVNADINFDQVQTTRETGIAPPAEAASRALPPLPAVAGAAAAPGASDPLPPLPASAAAPAAPVRTNRVLEQIVSAPGTVRRLSVAIVLEREPPLELVDKLQAVVAASAGIDSKRGDVVSIVVRDPALPVAAAATPVRPLPASAPARAQERPAPAFAAKDAALIGAAALLLLLGAVAWRVLRRRDPAPRRLSAAEREEFAARLKRLLDAQGEAHVRP
ncbi:flagellar basal-body MS-ring/collar protein FliF [Lysobacter enzymogenes]|uniref:flagellar basal-body MS-ring/collar protein FliF n=1 Tax=Lysobacter enzymogenes TaxID=69 RepID=UPI0038500770